MHWTSRHESTGVINLEHNFRTYGMVIAFGPDEGDGWRAWVSGEIMGGMVVPIERCPLFNTEREAKNHLLRAVWKILELDQKIKLCGIEDLLKENKEQK